MRKDKLGGRKAVVVGPQPDFESEEWVNAQAAENKIHNRRYKDELKEKAKARERAEETGDAFDEKVKSA